MTAYDWQKSSYCAQGDSCLHVAAGGDRTVKLTESGDPGGAILSTTPATWSALLLALKGNRG
ncbi:DUF397 domain-containing protein [Streptomyces sp. NBC_00191]|uniref:DUF397 domain-containing protein n=1 Tax=Streptomyces sp. NBC_00191 TaxID=2975674 RepID=UPI0032457F08